MSRSDKRQKGFSLLESIVVFAIAAIVMGTILPNFIGFMRNYRRDGVVEQVVGDVRAARSNAVVTGWQYRIFGYNSGATSSYKNQYRIMARSSSAVAWPADTAAPMQSSTQMAGNWVNIPALYPNVNLNPADGTPDFSVVFDSRGVRVALDPSFDPMVISSQAGSKSIRISAAGIPTVQ